MNLQSDNQILKGCFKVGLKQKQTHVKIRTERKVQKFKGKAILIKFFKGFILKLCEKISAFLDSNLL